MKCKAMIIFRGKTQSHDSIINSELLCTQRAERDANDCGDSSTLLLDRGAGHCWISSACITCQLDLPDHSWRYILYIHPSLAPPPPFVDLFCTVNCMLQAKRGMAAQWITRTVEATQTCAPTLNRGGIRTSGWAGWGQSLQLRSLAATLSPWRSLIPETVKCAEKI